MLFKWFPAFTLQMDKEFLTNSIKGFVGYLTMKIPLRKY